MADKPVRILIVDDSRAVQIILRRVLQNIGYAGAEFKFADNVKAALAILGEETQDILITDFHMPEITGIELLEQMRGKLSETMVGMITTETSPEILGRARALGADFTLSKPFTEAMLHESLCVARETFRHRQAEARPAGKPQLAVQSREMLPRHLRTMLKVGVKIEEMPDFSPHHWDMPWVVGFYGAGSDPAVRGTCVIDRGACLVIGGALLDAALPTASGAGVPEAYLKQVQEMLDRECTRLFKASPGYPPTLLKSQHSMNVNPRLKEMLVANKTTAVYRLQRSGWPEGHLAVMTH